MNFIFDIYPWIKALHIIAVVAWMAGIFYLPRLFVYHTEQVVKNSETDKMFQDMERRLIKAIMNPAMIITWVCGLIMIATGAFDFGAVWAWLKIASVFALSGFHGWLEKRRKDFVDGTNTIAGRQYRLMNEVPTVLLIIIVVSVVVRPF